MITNNLPKQRENLEVTPRPIELMLAEDGVKPLTLILQPLEDIAEINAHSKVNFSLKEFADIEWGKLESTFADELELLELKKNRFIDAPTYINRLANLAELSGDRLREESYLLRIRDIANDQFVAHRLGENFIARNLTHDAEELFSGLNLAQDAYANLRLAFFQLQRKDLDAALAYVSRAVSIDPLDFGVRLFEGSLHLVRGEHAQAIQSFRFAAEDRQTSCPLFTNLALAYIYVGKPEKAFASLRKAVALDPSNENAIALLADLAFSKGRNEDAIPSLRCFLQFEQKNSTMWARLARALLDLGNTKEAIETLKRQASIENTSLVWNNLGVAYHKQHEKKKAYEAFKYAMKLDMNPNSRNLFLAARNITSLLLEDHAYKDLLVLTGAIFTDDKNNMLLSDPQLGDIYIFHICALHRTRKPKEAVRMCEQILSTPNVALNITAWIVTSLISYYSLEEDTSSKAIELAIRYESILTTLSPQFSQLRDLLLNNITYAYLETGHIEQAKLFIQQLTHVIHKESYPTATLGLFHMRKGNIERAESLYEEAIHLAKTVEDKKRIRIKLNFELGTQFFNIDPLRARRYLQKVLEHDEIIPQISIRARSLLNMLTIIK